MKKNFILVAILLAVGVANAIFFISERDNSAELKIDNLEMMAEGESFGAGIFYASKLFFCEKMVNGNVQKKVMEECSDKFGLGCDDEDCPQGWTRQKEYKAFY